jgi:hypothetical protein
MRLLIAGLQVRVLPAELKKRHYTELSVVPFFFSAHFPSSLFGINLVMRDINAWKA